MVSCRTKVSGVNAADRIGLAGASYTKVHLLRKADVICMMMDGQHPVTLTVQLALSCLYHSIPLSGETLGKLFVLGDDGFPVREEDIYVENADGAPLPLGKRALPPGDGVDAEILERVKAAITIIAFTTVTNLHKEITQDNFTYVLRRMHTAGQTSNRPILRSIIVSPPDARFVPILTPAAWGPIRILIESSGAVEDLLLDACTCAHNIAQVAAAGQADAGAARPEAIEGADAPFLRAMEDMFKMVLKGYGLTAIKGMEKFVKIPSRALGISWVLAEAIEFDRTLRQFKEDHGDDWEYGRVLNLAGIGDLTARKYPHLYHCAVARLKGGARGSMQNYKQSNFDSELNDTPEKLARLARRDLAGATCLTAEAAASIHALTGRDVTASINRDLEEA